MTRARRAQRWALVGLFLLAFLPRALYPVSRPLQWYFRSARFFEAVLQGNWAGTIYSEHPGVTTMWLSGAALWGWYGIQCLLGLDPPTPLETQGYAFADRVAVGVLPLALLVSLGILWGWYLIGRLFGKRVAWMGALLWAIDPFYLTNSKSLHLDAILSTTMVLSALWMLLYLQEHSRRYLVISAVLAGLAILTKISAVFLFPFLGLCLLCSWILSPRRRALSHLRSVAMDLVLWVFVVAVVWLALWPSMWVQPWSSLDRVLRQGVLLHVDMPRDQPLLYRGTLGVQDPGYRFYLDVILYRTTFLTLPFAGIGLLSLAAGGQRQRLAPLLVAAFALFYFVQMSLGSWKDGRYLLPVFLMLDVLAALGLEWWTRSACPRSGRCRTVVACGLLATQALIVLLRHPYYGTHYNLLAGGSRAALRVFPPAENGEGLDVAGRYVDGLPGAEDLVVGTQFLANEMVVQYVRSPVNDIAQTGDAADYLVFGIQYTMRGQDYDRWGALWEQTYKFREPEFVVNLDGIPYAWVHRPDAEPVIPRQTGARLAEQIQLIGYRVSGERVAPGDKLLLTLYWQAEGEVEEDFTVFVHLQAPGGALVAQQDNPPARGARPTSGWEPGELIEDPYEVLIPPGATPGEYLLSAGMYDPGSMERLVVLGADGNRQAEDRVILNTVRVRTLVPWWHTGLCGMWVVTLVGGLVKVWAGREHE